MGNNMMKIGATSEGRRERLRLHYLAAAKVTTAKGVVVRGNLRDIGLDSLYIKIDKQQLVVLHPGEEVDVAIMVTRGASRLTIDTPGRIIREDDGGIAVMFSESLKWWPLFSLFPVNEHFLFDIVTKA
jgi:hypothetical protein